MKLSATKVLSFFYTTMTGFTEQLHPKGLRNIRGFGDPKIQLYKLLKTEIEPKLGDPDIVLDSFIISNTPYEEARFWNPVEDKSVFKKNHIIFQMDKGYIRELFGMIC